MKRISLTLALLLAPIGAHAQTSVQWGLATGAEPRNLQVRDTAGSWLTMGRINATTHALTLSMPNGSIAAPSYSFQSSPLVGMSWDGDGGINFSTTGGLAVNFDKDLGPSFWGNPYITGGGRNFYGININKNGTTLDKEAFICGLALDEYRWCVDFASGDPEGGSNTGSNFNVQRYANNGDFIDYPLTIYRNDGHSVFSNYIQTENSWPGVIINRPDTSYASAIQGAVGPSVLARWAINLGDNTAETGANAGSNFSIARFNDAGSPLGPVFSITRSTGAAAFNVSLTSPKVIINGSNITTTNFGVKGTVGASATPAGVFDDGTQWLGLFPNLTAGSFNSGIQLNDHGIVFSNGASGTGALFIGPWNASAIGARFTTTGVDFAGALTSGGTFVSTGTITASGGVNMVGGSSIFTSALGTTAGNSLMPWEVGVVAGTNAVRMRSMFVRNTGGSDWTTVDWTLRQRTDAVDQGFMTMNAQGISWGQGATAQAAVFIGGGFWINGWNATQPIQLIIADSTHATSRRAAVQIGTGWLLGQDSANSGTKDFFLYNISTTRYPIGVNTSDVVNFFTAPTIGSVAWLDSICGTSQGSICYKGASNWTALAPGTDGRLLRTAGAAANPSWGRKAPTRTVFTSGSTNYSVPSGASRLQIRQIAAGGGGAGTGTASMTAGTKGGDGSFNSITVIGGNGGALASGTSGGAGGTGGTGGAGACDFRIPGGRGENAPGANGQADPQLGGSGGNGVFGGAGTASNTTGNNGATNSGAGASGGSTGSSATATGGGGGGAGEYCEFSINGPTGPYAYTVGTVGTAGGAGTSGNAGGAGAAGLIIIDEFYD